ncbi:MAG: hypothetical protein HQK53_15405, partial [Oligoflexia bacterium]|nr:hypothetical protein [Oligoflexia bacterium]
MSKLHEKPLSSQSSQFFQQAPDADFLIESILIRALDNWTEAESSAGSSNDAYGRGPRKAADSLKIIALLVDSGANIVDLNLTNEPGLLRSVIMVLARGNLTDNGYVLLAKLASQIATNKFFNASHLASDLLGEGASRRGIWDCLAEFDTSMKMIFFEHRRRPMGLNALSVMVSEIEKVMVIVTEYIAPSREKMELYQKEQAQQLSQMSSVDIQRIAERYVAQMIAAIEELDVNKFSDPLGRIDFLQKFYFGKDDYNYNFFHGLYL